MPVPSGIAVRDGDILRIAAQYFSATTIVVAATLDVVYDDETRESVSINVTTSATARLTAANNQAYRFARNGVIVSAASNTGATTLTQSGMLYMAVWVTRNGNDIAQVLGGYFYSNHTLTYPGQVIGRTEGPGRVYTAAGADPAAGSEVADTVPANARWKLRAAEVVLVTDATVANRNTNLFADDAASTITRYLLLTDTTNQTATQTRTHSWTPGTDNDSTASVSVTDGVTLLAKYPMSLQNGVVLKSGDNIRTVTTGIVAGDNYGAPRYIVEEWLSE